jgi:hypothetical protein
MTSECPPWPQPDVDLIRLDAVFVLVTLWARHTYPAALDAWRRQYQPRVWTDVVRQQPPEIPVVAWRRALQGVE